MTREILTRMRYTEILNGNTALAHQLAGQRFTIRVLSNITVAPLKEILEFELRRNGINAVVTPGDYDNISQNSLEVGDTNAVIVFWELANLLESFSSRALTMDGALLGEVEKKTIAEMAFVLENLRNVPLVVFNSFSSLLFNSRELSANPLDRIASTLNTHLHASQHANLVVVDIDRCISRASVEKSFDRRLWHSSRILYSVEFFTNYVESVAPIFRALNGKAKKALIFDCDNTLWKGIIGEDGMEGIGISSSTKEGQPFYEVQLLALALHKQGVILGLCSKNNPADVEEVLEHHPGMVLRNEHLAIRRINWNDKVANLREIADTLNLGLDSFVFVDDSEFEAALVEQYLPQVEVLRVPKSLSDYPQFMRDHMNLFWVAKRTEEDLKRTVMYKQEADREQERTKFTNMEEYLRALDLVLTISCDSPKTIGRVAQLTQKTNQFNLTTKRYAETDIESFVSSPDWLVHTFSLADRFGDFGLTGVAILHLDSVRRSADIDTLLLSCRVLGRNAEIKFFDFLVDQMRERGVESVSARYLPTKKNSQVEGFYDARGFQLVQGDSAGKTYQLALAGYRSASIDYIQVRKGS